MQCEHVQCEHVQREHVQREHVQHEHVQHEHVQCKDGTEDFRLLVTRKITHVRTFSWYFEFKFRTCIGFRHFFVTNNLTAIFSSTVQSYCCLVVQTLEQGSRVGRVLLQFYFTLMIPTQGTLQAILSTDGMASFVTYLFNDGHGVGIKKNMDLLLFRAGDGIRNTTAQNQDLNLEGLRRLLNSFRIDGKSTIL